MTKLSLTDLQDAFDSFLIQRVALPKNTERSVLDAIDNEFVEWFAERDIELVVDRDPVTQEPYKARCPDCGALVASMFDHVDIDCLNPPTKSEMIAEIAAKHGIPVIDVPMVDMSLESMAGLPLPPDFYALELTLGNEQRTFTAEVTRYKTDSYVLSWDYKAACAGIKRVAVVHHTNGESKIVRSWEIPQDEQTDMVSVVFPRHKWAKVNAALMGMAASFDQIVDDCRATAAQIEKIRTDAPILREISTELVQQVMGEKPCPTT